MTRTEARPAVSGEVSLINTANAMPCSPVQPGTSPGFTTTLRAAKHDRLKLLPSARNLRGRHPLRLCRNHCLIRRHADYGQDPPADEMMICNACHCIPFA